jgi:hypothetical protein
LRKIKEIWKPFDWFSWNLPYLVSTKSKKGKTSSNQVDQGRRGRKMKGSFWRLKNNWNCVIIERDLDF